MLLHGKPPGSFTKCNVVSRGKVPTDSKGEEIPRFARTDETFDIGLGSSADGRAEGVGEGLAEALDVGFVFGFDHDAGELLGAGVA